jgi:hypothetical protein
MSKTDPEGGSYQAASDARSEGATGGAVKGAEETASKGSFGTKGKIAEPPKGLKPSGGLQPAGQAQNESGSASGNGEPESSNSGNGAGSGGASSGSGGEHGVSSGSGVGNTQAGGQIGDATADSFYDYGSPSNEPFNPIEEELFASGDDMPWGPDQGEDAEATNVHAFQLVSAGTALYVRKGTVNSLTPSISGGGELSTEYTDNELPIPGSNGTMDYWLVSTVDTNTGYVSAVSITNSDPGDDTNTQSKVPLGSVTTDASGHVKSVVSNLSGSLRQYSCGTYHYYASI